MKKRVVITGIGAIVPGSMTIEQLWDNLINCRSFINEISKFDTSNYSKKFAAEILDFSATDFMPKRLVRKLDLFTQYAIGAAKQALDDSKLNTEHIDKSRAGVYVGNCFGGWDFTDKQLRNLHTVNARMVSPFQATAWFPAAPQGQISILFGLKGQSKTIVAGRASGLISIGYAAQAIFNGRCDIIIAGATEAVINPFVYSSCLAEENNSPQELISPLGKYSPFDRFRSGWVPGEGSSFLVLEELNHANKRNANIYGEIIGFSSIFEPSNDYIIKRDENGMKRAMANALDDGYIDADDISCIIADATATEFGDVSEDLAIKSIFHGRKIPVTTPKPLLGHLYGAAGALDAVAASMIIKKQTIFPVAAINNIDKDLNVNIVKNLYKGNKINNILINSSGADGVYSSLIIGRV